MTKIDRNGFVMGENGGEWGSSDCGLKMVKLQTWLVRFLGCWDVMFRRKKQSGSASFPDALPIVLYVLWIPRTLCLYLLVTGGEKWGYREWLDNRCLSCTYP
jgi:hypothetical protein